VQPPSVELELQQEISVQPPSVELELQSEISVQPTVQPTTTSMELGTSVRPTSVDQELPGNTELDNVMQVVNAELVSRQQPSNVEPQDSMQPTAAELEYQQSCNTESQLLDLNSSCLSEILSEAHRELFSNDIVDDCIRPLANSSMCRACDVNDCIGEECDLLNCGQLLPLPSPVLATSDSQTPMAHVEIAARTDNYVQQKSLPVLILTQKRKRNKDTWKCSIRKRNRQAGLEYVATTGKAVSARCGTPKTIKDCLHKCKFKCAENISESVRQQIHTDFWQQSDDGKACFYAQTVKRYTKRRPQNKCADVSRRHYSYAYRLCRGEELVRVCKVFYLTTLNVSQRRIEYTLSVRKDAGTGIVRDDRRGQHLHHRSISKIQKDEVRRHIMSLPVVESHYRRASSKKQYLEAGLTLSQLYAKYLEHCAEQSAAAESDADRENFVPVKEHVYRHIFNYEFNLEFHKPKQDRCDTCELYKMKKEDEKYQHHMQSKKATKEERDRDRERVKSVPHGIDNGQQHSTLNAPSEAVICFDLENVLSCPRANISSFFYKRKLAVYHLTAHCSIDKRGYGAVWCETTSGRSANDLASALITILNMIIRQHSAVKKLILWSDSCVSQNRNSVMSFALQDFIRNNAQIECIEQKFCEPGHSSIQEVDNIHSHIEKGLKVSDIYSPLGLMRALLKVTPKRPLMIRQLNDDDFKDYHEAARKLKYSVVPYTKVKHAIYRQGVDYTVLYRTSFEEPLHEAEIHAIEAHSALPTRSSGRRSHKTQLHVRQKARGLLLAFFAANPDLVLTRNLILCPCSNLCRQLTVNLWRLCCTDVNPGPSRCL